MQGVVEPAAGRAGLRERLAVDGWAQVNGAIDRQSLGEAADWITESTAAALRLLVMQTQRDPSGALRKLRRMFWSDPDFWSGFVVRSGLRDVVVDVMGDDAVLLKHAAFLKAPDGGSAVGYHQDQALWETRIEGAYSFWMPLEPAGGDNGGLVMFTGSHTSGILPHDPRDDHPWHGVVDVDGLSLAGDQVQAEPGDLVVHSPFIVHGSPPNTSSKPRRATVFTFAPRPSEETRGRLVESFVALADIDAQAAGEQRIKPIPMRPGRRPAAGDAY